MHTDKVHLEKLDHMIVASVWGFGDAPEMVAWEKLESWAKPRGFFNDPEKHPIYGFNNPDPSPGSPNYGYELWMVVARETEPEGEVRIRSFAGGLYAVQRCVVPQGNFEVIGQTWKQLVTWREDSPYKFATHQWLEKSVLIPQWEVEIPAGIAFVMDLYLPVAE